MTLEDPCPAPAPTDMGGAAQPLNGHAPHLTAEEEEAVNLFMTHVNSWRRARSFSPLSRESSVKFLMARKFAVDRALTLYQQHELMRIREKLTAINSLDSPLKEDLLNVKFTVLGTRDASGAALALFNAHLHDPDKTVHKTTLQNVVYQLGKCSTLKMSVYVRLHGSCLFTYLYFVGFSCQIDEVVF